MAITTRHLTINIAYLLNCSDKELELYFEGRANDIRRDLENRKAKGHLKVGSQNCEGFCPVNGCPGHPVKDKLK